MEYTVKYRSTSGDMVSEVISADSRADAYEQVKQRGIAAISLTEGGKVKSAGASAGVPRKKLLIVVGALLAAVVLVVVGIAFFGDEARTPDKPAIPAQKKAERTPRHKPAVQPAVSPKTNEVAKVEVPKELLPQKVGETRDGYILLPSGRKHKVHGIVTNTLSSTGQKAKYEIFQHHVENEIASLLTMRPGEGIVGNPRYTPKLKEEFLKSLENPIIVYDEDSPEDKELKNAVIQTKIELKQRIDNGEDLGQILSDTRMEYQALSQYRMNIESEFSRLKHKEDVTDQELDDFVKAANILLEKKGIAPLKLGPITKQRLKMKDMKEQPKNQEK